MQPTFIRLTTDNDEVYFFPLHSCIFNKHPNNKVFVFCNGEKIAVSETIEEVRALLNYNLTTVLTP